MPKKGEKLDRSNIKLNKEIMQREMLIKVSKMYYEDGMSQQEISDKLKVSRSYVSKILLEAKRLNIVDIRINDVSLRTLSIQDEVKRKYHLKDIIIAPSDADYHVNLSNIGVASAEYLENHVKDSMKIGVAWGTNIYYMVTNLKAINKSRIEVIQLMGGMNWGDSYKYGIQVILNLADKLGGLARFWNAPLMIDNIPLKNELMEEKIIKDHIKLFEKIDMAFVGIGTNDPLVSPLKSVGLMTKRELERIWNKGIKAHICIRCINMDGSLAKVRVNDKIIGIELEQLKKIPNVVGIAGGEDKVEPIIACLRGGYIDTLITDEKTAILVANYEE